MAAILEELLERLVQAADHSQVKLETTAGMPTWEAMPGMLPATMYAIIVGMLLLTSIVARRR